MKALDIQIEESWKRALVTEFDKAYFFDLIGYVKLEYSRSTCYPPGSMIFKAFNSCPLNRVKVVVLGQDPYHGPGQANGLSFSVNKGRPLPPSLINIYKELQGDLGLRPPEHGDLGYWSSQGVLLLNSMLSVRAGEAGSHQKKGWEEFTDAAIQAVNDYCENVVFILWGAYAQKKGYVVDRERHLILSAPHPSPLSAHRGFFGSRPFSKTNEYLSEVGKRPIDWVKK